MNKKTIIKALPYVLLAFGCFSAANASEITGTLTAGGATPGSSDQGSISGNVNQPTQSSSVASSGAGSSRSSSRRAAIAQSSSQTSTAQGPTVAFADTAPVSSDAGLVAYSSGSASDSSTSGTEIASASELGMQPDQAASNDGSLAAIGAATDPSMGKILFAISLALAGLGGAVYAVNRFFWVS